MKINNTDDICHCDQKMNYVSRLRLADDICKNYDELIRIMRASA